MYIKAASTYGGFDVKIPTLINNMTKHIGIRALATASFILLILLALAYMTIISYNEKPSLPISSLGIWRVSNMSMMTALIPLVIGFLVLISSIMLLSNNTTIRGTVLSFNLFTSVLLVAAIFSPWINCAGMMGGGSNDTAESGMVSKSQARAIAGTGCPASVNDGVITTTTVETQHVYNMNIQYVMAVESDGLVSLCAYYDASTESNYSKLIALGDPLQDPRKVFINIIGSLQQGSAPGLNDVTIYDSAGNSKWYMVGTGQGPCGTGGHLVADELEVYKFTTLYIQTMPLKTCNPDAPATIIMGNPAVQYSANKEAYQ
jgi:hypothetical protein